MQNELCHGNVSKPMPLCLFVFIVSSFPSYAYLEFVFAQILSCTIQTIRQYVYSRLFLSLVVSCVLKNPSLPASLMTPRLRVCNTRTGNRKHQKVSRGCPSAHECNSSVNIDAVCTGLHVHPLSACCCPHPRPFCSTLELWDSNVNPVKAFAFPSQPYFTCPPGALRVFHCSAHLWLIYSLVLAAACLSGCSSLPH